MEITAQDLTKEQKLFLLSAVEGAADIGHPAPVWLVDECCALGLARRSATAVVLTPLGERLRAEMLA